MNFNGKKAENIKIAYIGGGSRGWAWGLMSDLASADDISGSVYLYDIDFAAAKSNEIIGNKYSEQENAKSRWCYYAVKTAVEALSGADFVVISILPGTFDEMESDVHTPVFAGEIPKPIYPLVSRICGEQENLSAVIADRDLDAILREFENDPLVTCSKADAKKLFYELVESTRAYLSSYFA